MKVDSQKDLGRRWHHQHRDEGPENQRPQRHALLWLKGSASQTCPQTGGLLLSPALEGPLPSCNSILVWR